MSVQVAFQEKLETEECYTCGIYFAIPQRFRQNRKKDHKEFYCPSGHGQAYIDKSEEEKLRETLVATEKRLRDTLARENELRKKHENQSNRIKNGVCPCCKRTFKRLADHMKTKHPTFENKVS